MQINSISRRRGTWVNVASELYEIQTQRKALEEKEHELKDRLKTLSHNRPATGCGFLFSVSFRKGAINYDTIPALKCLNLEPFRKEEVAMWKLSRIEG